MRRVTALLLLACVIGAGVLATGASADDIHSTQGFRRAVTPDGVREHQAAFQAFADLNGGHRAASNPGYEASADYVRQRMLAAGYQVSDHFFNFLYNADRTPPAFEQVSPSARTYVDGLDFSSMTYSRSGDVTAPVYAVDLVLPPPPAENGNTSGCEAADFAGFPAGHIALIQRSGGGCTYGLKAANAAAAGAAGVIIFNEGQPDRTGFIDGTLGSNPPHGVPVVGASFAAGQELAGGVTHGPTGSVARVRIDRVEELRTTRSVIAETHGGDPERVVVVGSHLDSSTRGAGVNDNGSGAATIMEIAEVYAAQGREPRNKLRFIWFGAAEFGLLGSANYVAALPDSERQRILCMLNFDALGSPNYARFIYDGDNSAGANSIPAPAGSAFLEHVFLDYFTSQGMAAAPLPLDGRSDYAPFAAAGVIPVGGLSAGDSRLKTAAQAAAFGGVAGAPYDACSRLACDTLDNNSVAALDQMSDAAAHAVLILSKTRERIR